MLNLISKLFSLRLPKVRIPTMHELCHRSYKLGHTSYFGFVFLEGHGIYATIGGGLFILAFLDLFLHFE